MKEETITKSILDWLIKNDWCIVCYDFPQSGTGFLLHPNDNKSEKNKGTINPDIVAVKGRTCVFFENKDRFYYQDFVKQNSLKIENNYSVAIEKLLYNYSVEFIYYGIGLPSIKYSIKADKSKYLVDFIVGVEESKQITILHNSQGINF